MTNSDTGTKGLCPKCGSDQYGCFESVAVGYGWICQKTEEFPEALANMVKLMERNHD